MKYLSNNFSIDGFSANSLAKKYSTPIYCYSFNKIKDNVKEFKTSFKKINPIICFSVKSNSNKQILKEIGKLQLGADVVSLGELMKALNSGIEPNKIVFSGVGKTLKEISYAIEKKILLINANQKVKFQKLKKLLSLKKKVNIGVRLNPNTDPETLSQISTGKKENKFGVSEKAFLNLVKYLKNQNM